MKVTRARIEQAALERRRGRELTEEEKSIVDLLEIAFELYDSPEPEGIKDSIWFREHVDAFLSGFQNRGGKYPDSNDDNCLDPRFRLYLENTLFDVASRAVREYVGKEK